MKVYVGFEDYYDGCGRPEIVTKSELETLKWCKGSSDKDYVELILEEHTEES